MKIGDTATIEMFLKYGPLGMQLKRDYGDGYLCYSAEAASELSEKAIEHYSSYCSTELPFVPGFIFHNPDYGIIQHLGVAWTRFETNEYVISKLPTKLLKRTSL